MAATTEYKIRSGWTNYASTGTILSPNNINGINVYEGYGAPLYCSYDKILSYNDNFYSVLNNNIIQNSTDSNKNVKLLGRNTENTAFFTIYNKNKYIPQ